MFEKPRDVLYNVLSQHSKCESEYVFIFILYCSFPLFSASKTMLTFGKRSHNSTSQVSEIPEYQDMFDAADVLA